MEGRVEILARSSFHNYSVPVTTVMQIRSPVMFYLHFNDPVVR
jgi:hypothetical protein